MAFGNYTNSQRMRKTRKLLGGPLYSTTTKFIGPRRRGYGSVARTRGAAVQGEMKYFDCECTATNLVACTTTWVAGTLVDPTTTINLGSAPVATPLCLFAPTVGAALNQRIGRQVKMFKVKVHGLLTVPPQAAQAAADASTMIRMMLVLDKQANAAPMTSAQLMRDAGAGGTTINSFQNPDNFGRFRVLKEREYSVSNLNVAGSPTAGDVIQVSWSKPFKMSKKLGGLPVRFNATNGGTVADLIDNALHIIIAVNNAAYVVNVAYYTRVCYKE